MKQPKTLSDLLESQHETLLQWCEPWPARGAEGNDLVAHITLRATVHDCINMQRRAAKAAGRPTIGNDGNHLLDFIAIHWTQVVEANSPVCPRGASDECPTNQQTNQGND